MKSLEEVIGPSDPPTTEPERLSAFNERFEQKVRAIAAGESHLNSVLMVSDDDLAFDAVGDVIASLEKNQLSTQMRNLLSNHLSRLDVDECRRLLGVPRPSGRPTKSRETLLAVEAYVLVSELPRATEELALAAAYEAYDTAWNYERDSKRPRPRGLKTEPISEAQYRIDRWIRPILIRAGCSVSRPPKGRKPKLRRKPTPSY